MSPLKSILCLSNYLGFFFYANNSKSFDNFGHGAIVLLESVPLFGMRHETTWTSFMKFRYEEGF